MAHTATVRSNEWWCHSCGFHFTNIRPCLGAICPGSANTHKSAVDMKPTPPKEKNA